MKAILLTSIQITSSVLQNELLSLAIIFIEGTAFSSDQESDEAEPAQFIIATHSPIAMACPGAKIFSFDRVLIKQVNDEDTIHYKIYIDLPLRDS